jgi:uncharacterized protein
MLRRKNLEFDHMKFQPDSAEGINIVTRHEPGRIWVGGESFAASVLVPWAGAVQPWQPSQVGELAPSHFEQILALEPALVIFGSGLRLQLIKPALYRALIERGIGLESMDTAAACRTYNVLAYEGRMVVAALLLGPQGQDTL